MLMNSTKVTGMFWKFVHAPKDQILIFCINSVKHLLVLLWLVFYILLFFTELQLWEKTDNNETIIDANLSVFSTLFPGFSQFLKCCHENEKKKNTSLVHQLVPKFF